MAGDRVSDDEGAIRALLEARLAAIRGKDVAGSTAALAEDVVAFDVVAPLQHHGRAGMAQRAQSWFAQFSGERVGYEYTQLRLVVSGNVAFAHALAHAHGPLAQGGALDMWWRTTQTFERREGRWWITHTHDSVPFDPRSGQPSLSLKP